MRTRWHALLPVLACAPVHANEVTELRYNPFDRPELEAVAPAQGPSESGGWPKVLRATLVDGASALANLDGRFATVGDTLDGALIVAIGEGTVTLARDGERRTLTLHPATPEQDDE